MSIKILYHFESDAHFLSEIKDESIISDDKSKIYNFKSFYIHIKVLKLIFYILIKYFKNSIILIKLNF